MVNTTWLRRLFPVLVTRTQTPPPILDDAAPIPIPSAGICILMLGGGLGRQGGGKENNTQANRPQRMAVLVLGIPPQANGGENPPQSSGKIGINIVLRSRQELRMTLPGMPDG
jgi:hypothetical protein